MSENARYVNPLTDYGFKLIFGTEVNKDLLIDFLNQMLPAAHQVENVHYLPTEAIGEDEEERIAIFDVHFNGMDKEQFVIEMQNAHQLYLKDRSLFYATDPVRRQGPKGKWNYKLSPVFTVCIMNFVFRDELLKQKQKTLHKIYLRDEEGDIFYDKLAFFYVELPNFKKSVDELETQFDKWVYVLKHLATLDDCPEVLREPIFLKLFRAAEVANFSAKERKAYNESMKRYREMDNFRDSYRAEGYEIGVMEERSRGEKLLEEERFKLEQKLRESAQAMKAGGLSLEQISNFLNITIDEVKRLLNDTE